MDIVVDMKRGLAAAMACLYLVGCVAEQERVTAEEAGATEVELAIRPCATTNEDAIRIDTIASGLDVPWDVAFLPDGRALVTERPGRIRVITAEGLLLNEPWAELDVFAQAEAGLMGVDVAVGDSGSAVAFVAATVQELGSNRMSRLLRGIGRRASRAIDPEFGHSTWLQLFRIEELDGKGGDPVPIVTGLPAASVHAGGAVRFGPDGLLYLSSGEAGSPWMAQSGRTTRGKILRYNSDGSVPADNPLPGSPIYATGLRNTQGLAWHPLTGELLAIDHGPTGLEREQFRTDLDELNVVSPGANFGWPIVTGATEGGALTSPIADWRTAHAPAGLTVLTRGGSAWTNSIFVSGLRGAGLDRMEVEKTSQGLEIVCRESLLRSRYGRLRLVRAAPDGTIWVGTSNRDHRGLPGQASDLLLRVHPPTS